MAVPKSTKSYKDSSVEIRLAAIVQSVRDSGPLPAVMVCVLVETC